VLQNYKFIGLLLIPYDFCSILIHNAVGIDVFLALACSQI
jgi:hypothetical protein